MSPPKNTKKTHATTNTKLTHSDSGQARPYARVNNAATHLTQLGPAQAQRKHAPTARVSRPICKFLHSRLMPSAERKCTRTTDVSGDIYSRRATADTRSGVASTDARDITQDAHSSIHEDANSNGASTDTRIGGANTNACGRSPGDTVPTIMSVSYLMRYTVILIPLLMQRCTESSSQPCQLEHALSITPASPSTRDAAVQTLPAPTLCKNSSQARQLERAPPTGGKPCAKIVPMSLWTRDNAMQTIKIETSAGSADVTTQSASSADSTKTPANGAITEVQKYSSEYEAQLKLHEAQLKLQEALIRLYGNGLHNHKQKETISKLRSFLANCREMQALEIGNSLEKGPLSPRARRGTLVVLMPPTHLFEHDKAAIAPPSPRYTPPRADPFLVDCCPHGDCCPPFRLA